MNPILLNIPDQFESARLLIRCPRPGDGVVLFEAIMDSKPELDVWFPWARSYKNADEAEEWVRRSQANWILRETLVMLLFSKADGAFVGVIDLHDIDWTLPMFEIGYWLRTNAVGQGFMTEAVNRITLFCRETLGAVRIEVWCDTRNLKSRAVAERAGFRLEAEKPNRMRTPDGELTGAYLFAKTWPSTNEVEP